MKKKFKVIATATVAIGMVGLAAQGLAQETETRDIDRDATGSIVESAADDIQNGCNRALQSANNNNMVTAANSTSSVSGRETSTGPLAQFQENCFRPLSTPE